MSSFTFSGSLAGRSVDRIGFGVMQLPGPGVLGPPRDRDQAIAVLHRAVELGVDHIDTAQFYGPDVANELIREALHPYPENLLLVSKVGSRRDAEGAWHPAQTPAELRSAIEDNLRSLDVERLGAVNLRRMLEHDLPADQVVPLEDQLAEMVAMRDEGKIEAVGISTAPLAEVEVAIATAGIVCVQNSFSLLDQSDSATLTACRDAGVAYVPYFPLGSAFPHLPKVVDDPTVQAVAARLDATPAQIGLAWLLAHDPSVLLIPGTSSLAHLEQNVASGNVTLSADDLDELDAITHASALTRRHFHGR